jgi:hypothetical protein
MPIREHPKDHLLEPERIEAMRLAFEKACEALHITGKGDALSETVAMKIVELGSGGEIDPERLCSQAISSLLGLQKAS